MAKKQKFYAAINDVEARIVTTWAECEVIAINTPGGTNKKCSTYEEAEQYLEKLVKERYARLKSKNPKRNSSPKQPKVIKLTCKLGTGGFGSTIKGFDCKPYIFKTSAGAKTALMNLELGCEALKLADNHIKQGADTVEILGLNASVGNTLNNFAPNWKANNWVNSSGKSPANLELVQSMFELYEQIKGKVTLGVKQAV